MTSEPIHLIIATGGTGGHFYPALALAEECRERGHKVSLVISGQREIEHRQEAVHNGFQTFRMAAPKLPDRWYKSPDFLLSMGASYRRAHTILKGLDVDVVLGMGSFACFPLCAAAGRRKIPVVLHEGNSVVGKANRFLSRWASTLALSLPAVSEVGVKCPSCVTGMPVRQKLEKPATAGSDREEFVGEYGLDQNKPTILVFGGSQGAHGVNCLAREAFEMMTSDNGRFQVIHITGEGDREKFEKFYKNKQIAAYVSSYEKDIERCYAAADLVICRAGASSVAELALFGLPGIFIPLPSSSEGHQEKNAAAVSCCDGGYVIDQNDEDAKGRLVELLRSRLERHEDWKEQGENIMSLAKFNAAGNLANVIEKVVNEKRGKE